MSSSVRFPPVADIPPRPTHLTLVRHPPSHDRSLRRRSSVAFAFESRFRGDARMRNDVGRTPPRAGISPYLVTLLALAMFLNYTDRGSLSIVAPALQHQLKI